MRVIVAAAAAVLVAAGCATGPPSADRGALARATLQQDVYKLTALAAGHQYVPARGWLEQVQQDMMYARSSGAIGVAQEDRIAAFVDRVRSDLAAEIDALSRTSAAAAPRSSSSSSPSGRPAPSRTRSRSSTAAAHPKAAARTVRHVAPPPKHAAHHQHRRKQHKHHKHHHRRQRHGHH
jgi:hypothetical protein